MNSNVSSPVNLGNPEEHTILEFAQLIKNLVGSGSEIQFLSEAQDDPQKRKPDIKKAKLMLGWEPVVPLEEGLNKAIHYFRKELEYQANNQYIPKPKPARIKKDGHAITENLAFRDRRCPISHLTGCFFFFFSKKD